ncbi:MAG: hypothetical protein AB7F74_23165 [Parvibaculaceae bacterium]
MHSTFRAGPRFDFAFHYAGKRIWRKSGFVDACFDHDFDGFAETWPPVALSLPPMRLAIDAGGRKSLSLACRAVWRANGIIGTMLKQLSRAPWRFLHFFSVDRAITRKSLRHVE